MMMMQNAQMHHMVMQQLMANTLKPGNSSNLPSLPVLNESQLVAVQVGILRVFWCALYTQTKFHTECSHL